MRQRHRLTHERHPERSEDLFKLAHATAPPPHVGRVADAPPRPAPCDSATTSPCHPERSEGSPVPRAQPHAIARTRWTIGRTSRPLRKSQPNPLPSSPPAAVTYAPTTTADETRALQCPKPTSTASTSTTKPTAKVRRSSSRTAMPPHSNCGATRYPPSPARTASSSTTPAATARRRRPPTWSSTHSPATSSPTSWRSWTTSASPRLTSAASPWAA